MPKFNLRLLVRQKKNVPCILIDKSMRENITCRVTNKSIAEGEFVPRFCLIQNMTQPSLGLPPIFYPGWVVICPVTISGKTSGPACPAR